MPKDKETQGARQRIERPISCRFCRSRKLRCSRKAPCSNCVSRGIVCELPVENTIRSTTTNGAPSATQPELLERIRKLEELVESQKLYANGSAVQHTKQSPESSDTPHTLQTHTSRSTLSPEIEHLDDDVAWLKSIYTAQNLSVSASHFIPKFRSNDHPIRITHPQIRSPSGFAQSSKSHRRNLISTKMRISHLHVLSPLDASGYHSTQKLRYFSRSLSMTLTMSIISPIALHYQLCWTRFMLV